MSVGDKEVGLLGRIQSTNLIQRSNTYKIVRYITWCWKFCPGKSRVGVVSRIKTFIDSGNVKCSPLIRSGDSIAMRELHPSQSIKRKDSFKTRAPYEHVRKSHDWSRLECCFRGFKWSTNSNQNVNSKTTSVQSYIRFALVSNVYRF